MTVLSHAIRPTVLDLWFVNSFGSHNNTAAEDQINLRLFYSFYSESIDHEFDSSGRTQR